MPILLILFYTLFSPTSLLATERIFIKLGTSHALNVSTHQNIRVTHPNIISIHDQGAQIQIIGKKTGEADILIGSRRIRIGVFPPKYFDQYQALQTLVSEQLGLKVISSKGLPSISGTLHLWKDWLDIAKSARYIKGLPYLFKAEVDETVIAKANTYFAKMVRSHRLPLPTLSLNYPQKVLIEQNLKKHDKRWKQIFYPFGLPIEYVSSGVSLSPLIRVQVIIAEVSRSHSKTLGIKWSGGYSTKIFSGTDSTDSFTALIQALVDQSDGQILAAPRLLSRSGSKASFLAGGEIPIRLISERSASITWKKHGVLLEIKPISDWAGNMSIEITSEVSTVDGSLDGVPIMKTNRLSSHFDIKSGMTISLSGLIRDQSSKNKSGLPYLRTIPILGPLFQSNNYLTHQSELMIFVTPQLIQPTLSEPRTFPDGWNHEPTQ